ncbi:uncharacterized protein LOC128999573 [Macrosteles quadrilineatus]|uniref:uncharacterized protein LOC128999573 n=1 Tax=Macrosteles quadrilineatus TaxID=74068 RepID=UPI0023E23FCD|nr:uncharacterized protein LOC128999573 [Macrosteles quadrilineatus]
MSGKDEDKERKDSSSALTIDRAAFLLLRVKRVFRKKKQQRKEAKAAAEAAAAAAPKISLPGVKQPPPLLRSRTLPAIVVPGISILQAQIDTRYKESGGSCSLSTLKRKGSHHDSLHTPQHNAPRFSFADTNTLDPRRHLAHHRLSSPEATTGAELQLPSPAPRLSTGSATLGRLARLLNQRAGGDTTPRRLSWETIVEEYIFLVDDQRIKTVPWDQAIARYYDYPQYYRDN